MEGGVQVNPEAAQPRRIYRGDFRDLASSNFSALGVLIFWVRVSFLYC